MFYRFPSALVLAAITLLGAGCGSGASTSSINFANCAGAGGDNAFCLVSCSLGCSGDTCTVTDIAANQPITLSFSRNVDPESVNFDTVSIKTAAGRAPEGRFEVSGNRIEFVPQVKVVGGVTAFGFISGETYVLTLPDSAVTSQTLRATSGDSLSRPLSCTLRVSRGIIDLDQAPPRARLISPATTKNVPKDAVIILEFSEIIDIAPFRGSTTQTSPIQYLLRKTRQDPKPGSKPEDRICDVNAEPLILDGLPVAENIPGLNITRVTLRPSVLLPSQVCVEIIVTDQVHDLAGTPAEPHSFAFTTEILQPGEANVTENFASDARLDKTVSSGQWGGTQALPPQVGGDGSLGPLKVEAGRTLGNNAYEWSTDSMVIDGQFTPTGQPITVTGGVFQFTTFTLPAGFELRFVGSNIAQIRVQGECRIDGKITVNSPSATFYNATIGSVGQPGAPGGPGGGRGGQGGDRCSNTGPSPNFDGRVGEDVRLGNGHGYTAEAAQTGGRGSPHWPRSGQNTEYCALSNTFASHTAAGGGGGGFHQVGGVGQTTRNPCQIASHSGTAPNSGGNAFGLIGFAPKTQGPDASLNHYTVGGSGGGGGGSHPLLSRSAAPLWVPGSAGAGGGGVIAIRAGQTVTMGSAARIEARGGAGFVVNGVSGGLFNVPAPGGGGSGGSILIQAYAGVTMNGMLDASGGKAGELNNQAAGQPQLLAQSKGGDGSPGFIRIETRNGLSPAEVGTSIPGAATGNVGVLTDREFKGTSQSLFYSTRLTFPPNFLRYEVEALIDNQRVLYSDDADHKDPDFAGRADSTKPVHFQLQGAKVSATTGEPDLKTLMPENGWYEAVFSRSGASLNEAKATGFRFRMIFDTANGSRTIVVKRVSVFFIE